MHLDPLLIITEIFHQVLIDEGIIRFIFMSDESIRKRKYLLDVLSRDFTSVVYVECKEELLHILPRENGFSVSCNQHELGFFDLSVFVNVDFLEQLL